MNEPLASTVTVNITPLVRVFCFLETGRAKWKEMNITLDFQINFGEYNVNTI